ncbi:MAG: ATP-binding cassette domain-containing protein [Candidatus Rokubacteria bacterium]|nr:ATP-binding cassette domain-containing protein [Candidatus Rokubacteria bacterium]
MTVLVEAKDVRKSFETLAVLKGVSFRLDKGETLVVMGGSGSGKTVLLRIIDGLLRPDGGAVMLFDQHIERLSEEAMLPVRRRLGYVFQGAALFDSLTVEENVAFPLREHTDLSAREIHERVIHFLSLVGLDEKVLPQLPAELSGGMRKRVGIARALIGQPDVLLFDEPTAGLDPTNSKLVGELISELGSEVCDTAIVVTHDLELAKTVADRVAVLIEGRFATIGRLDDVLGSRDPAVQAFLSGEAR